MCAILIGLLFSWRTLESERDSLMVETHKVKVKEAAHLFPVVIEPEHETQHERRDTHLQAETYGTRLRKN